MKAKAVRLYGKNEMKLEEFELPKIKDDEVLVKVVSNGICMSTYKAVIQGEKHKRVPEDISKNPTIMGHEFSGEIVEIGAKWKKDFKKGDKFAIQPALNYKGKPDSPGYSYEYCGGNSTYAIIPKEVLELGHLIKYSGKAFFEASLSEPMSCIIGGFHSNYHTESGKYVHHMGIVEGGNMALIAGVGPMGLGAIEYAVYGERKPKLLVVTDIDENRIKRAESLISPADAKKEGVELKYVNTKDVKDVPKKLIEYTDDKGYDDVFVYAPIDQIIEDSDAILGKDGCMNFFAGPTKKDFKAKINFYNIHYSQTHILGSTGGNVDDMKESLELSAEGKISPAVMVTHIGGLDSVIETIENLPDLSGGKKLIYTWIEMPLTAIEDFEELGKKDEFFKKLHEICDKTNGLWSLEAEEYLLKEKTIE